MPEEKAASSSDRNLIGALCYIPILFISILVPLYVLLTEKKQDKFLAFHAWQSLIFTVITFVVSVAVAVVTIILSVVLAAVTMGLGGLLMPCIFLPLMLLLLVVDLFAAYKAYQGETYKLPVIGDFAAKQANK